MSRGGEESQGPNKEWYRVESGIYVCWDELAFPQVEKLQEKGYTVVPEKPQWLLDLEEVAGKEIVPR